MSASTKPKPRRQRSPQPQHTNPEVERAVLGDILVMPEYMAPVAEMLTPDDFENARCATLYAAMLAVHQAGRSVDFVAVDDELQRMRELDDRGVFVHELVNSCTNPVMALQHASTVLKNSIARQRQAVGNALMLDSITGQEATERLAVLDAREDRPAAAQPDSLADLMAEELPARRWIVPDLISEGLVFLGAKQKTGKSWMAYGLGIAVAMGGMFLGRRLEQGEVLYLALEDGKKRLQDRGRKLLAGGTAPAALHVRTEWPRLDAGGLVRLNRWLHEHPGARLVIVDVFQHIRPPHGKYADAYQEDYSVCKGLKTVADAHHIALVLVHHTRKASADDHFDELHGSTALAGAADATLILTRTRGERDGELHVTGREVENEATYQLRFDSETCAWQPMSEGELAQRRERNMSQERQNVVRVIRAAGHTMSPGEIARALEIRDDDKSGQAAVRVMLGKMVDAGQLASPARGVYDLIGRDEDTKARLHQLHRLQPASDADSPATGERLHHLHQVHSTSRASGADVTDVTDTVQPAKPENIGNVNDVTNVTAYVDAQHAHNDHKPRRQAVPVMCAGRDDAHKDAWVERSAALGGGWVCTICHPAPEPLPAA